jgi:hypothetical protein
LGFPIVNDKTYRQPLLWHSEDTEVLSVETLAERCDILLALNLQEEREANVPLCDTCDQITTSRSDLDWDLRLHASSYSCLDGHFDLGSRKVELW